MAGRRRQDSAVRGQLPPETALVAAQPQDDYRGAVGGTRSGCQKGRGGFLAIARNDNRQAESDPADGRLATLGFSPAKLGGHVEQSMTLIEIEGLLDATRPDATDPVIRRSVLDASALAKPTLTSRQKSLQREAQV
jgi:hypothetical protein